nr:hypothetical protein [uncultured Methanoregula sp.]
MPFSQETAANQSLSSVDRVIAISAGDTHSLALLENGTVAAWGSNSSGQCGIPSNLTNVTGIAAGGEFSVAIKNDGSVVAWGCRWEPQPMERHQSTTPVTCDESCPCHVPANLTHVKTVSASSTHVLALKEDGTVVAWGRNYSGECNVPVGLKNVTAISAGDTHSLALKDDGSVVAWGRYTGRIPVGFRNCSGIAAGTWHSLLLKDDGTLDTFRGTSGFDSSFPLYHPSLSNVTAISAGPYFYLALLGNGSVIAWSGEKNGLSQRLDTAGKNLTRVTAISAGRMYSLALKNDGTVVAWGDCGRDGSCEVPRSFRSIIVSSQPAADIENLENVTVTTAQVIPTERSG